MGATVPRSNLSPRMITSVPTYSGYADTGYRITFSRKRSRTGNQIGRRPLYPADHRSPELDDRHLRRRPVRPAGATRRANRSRLVPCVPDAEPTRLAEALARPTSAVTASPPGHDDATGTSSLRGAIASDIVPVQPHGLSNEDVMAMGAPTDCRFRSR